MSGPISGARSRHRGRPATLLAVLLAVAFAVALTGGLGACGKRGDLEPPEGEGAGYTWPRVYPDPATVRPREKAAAEAEAETETGQVPSRRQAPAHASDITSFPEAP